MEDFSELNFTVKRLCGGIDILLTPERKIPIDTERVHELMKSDYGKNKNFVNFDWRDYSVTVYPAGSILFFHQNNKGSEIALARELLAEIYDEKDVETVGYVEEKV